MKTLQGTGRAERDARHRPDRCGHGRDAYRFFVPRLVAAGYRVAATDLRGAGESDTGFTGFSRTDIASDLVALIRHLGGPAVLVGHSISGGAATIAAATAPALLSAIVELAPFTRKQSIVLADLRVWRFRQGYSCWYSSAHWRLEMCCGVRLGGGGWNLKSVVPLADTDPVTLREGVRV